MGRAGVAIGSAVTEHVAGDNNWPADLGILIGNRNVDACLTEQIDGWFFNYYGRDVALEAVLIENTSTQPIKISRLVGARVAEPRLRPASTAAPSPAAPFGDMAEALAPGQTLLVPTAVVLVPPRNLRAEFAYPQASEAIFGELRGNGFTGNPVASGAPELRDYVFGQR